MDMHEHIKEFWPKRLAIAHYEDHIAWCKCKIAVQEERDSWRTPQLVAWYQRQIDECLRHIEEINADNT